ncbi:MAG: TadE/TadG family type IV pilus assembly protein [Pseudomonadota bacterium]
MSFLRRLLPRFRSDQSGATTVEFLIAMPLVVFWFAGSYTFFQAYSEWTRSVKATYTVADILSRQATVDDAFIDQMNVLFASIMGENTNDVYLRVSSIEQTDSGLTIDWSVATGLHHELKVDEEIPDEIIPSLVAGQYTILVESHMNYTPFKMTVGVTGTVLTKKVAVSPRFHTKLANTDHN